MTGLFIPVIGELSATLKLSAIYCYVSGLAGSTGQR